MAEAKRRTTLTLTGKVCEEARALGLNLSAIADAAIAQQVLRARRDAWARTHAASA